MAKKKESGAGKRTGWFDEKTKAPLIEGYVRELDTFVQTMADGRVDEKEVRDQEARLVAAMKEVEPLLDDATHEKVTRLLCELTAYDLMQTLFLMDQARPKSRFRG